MRFVGEKKKIAQLSRAITPVWVRNIFILGGVIYKITEKVL